MKSSPMTVALCGSWLIGALLPAASQASDGPVPSLFTRLSQNAEQGHFTEVLASLETHTQEPRTPRVASLIHDLTRYRDRDQERDLERQETYADAMTQMTEELEADAVDEALVKALEASDLSDDRETMRRDERVVALVQATLKAAEESEAGGDWVEAASFYRALDLLFDNSSPEHHNNLKRTAQHVRILRMYAPRTLHDLAVARIQRDGKEDEIEEYLPSDETWEQRLNGATTTIVKRVLNHAVDRHVAAPSYEMLLRGSLDTLRILIDTEPLADTFTQLADPAKTEAFRKLLRTMRRSLEARRDPLSKRGMYDIVDRIARLNNRTIDLPDEVLAFELAHGAMRELDDFTTVIWPDEVAQFQRNTKGSFFGVGIQISSKHNPKLHRRELLVVSPLPDTPARRAGIQADDIIEKVDSQSTKGWTLDRAVREITGPEGTVVTLTVKRGEDEDLIDFPITRGRIPIQSVRGWNLKPNTDGEWSYWIDRPSGIGYVRLSQFIPQTADGLDAAINLLDAGGQLAGLILDLRFNPGGLLQSAVQITDRFIPDGKIVSTESASGLARRHNYVAQARHTYRDIDLVVLINKHSASASEIVAGAIQDHRRGLVIGDRSFGKGSVQDLIALNNQRTAFLKLTTQYYKLPHGRIIHRKPTAEAWGIDADLHIRMTDQEIKEALEHRRSTDVIRDEQDESREKPTPTAGEILTKSLDPQLEAALLFLKTRFVEDDLQLAKRAEMVTVP